LPGNDFLLLQDSGFAMAAWLFATLRGENGKI